jgi:hypothetical protein
MTSCPVTANLSFSIKLTFKIKECLSLSHGFLSNPTAIFSDFFGSAGYLYLILTVSHIATGVGLSLYSLLVLAVVGISRLGESHP